MKNYSGIDVFINSSVIYKRYCDNKIIYYILSVLILMIAIVLVSFIYKFEIYDIYYGKVIIEDNKSFVNISVDNSFINSVKRNYLEVNDKEYKCSLVEYSDTYYLVNDDKVWNVLYECELPEILKVNNNLLEIKLNKKKTTLIKIVYEKIRRGFKNARIKR